MGYYKRQIAIHFLSLPIRYKEDMGEDMGVVLDTGGEGWLADMAEWTDKHADATIEETAAALREVPMKKSLGVCGKREQKDEG